MVELDIPEQNRRLKKGFKFCIVVFIAVSSLFIIGLIINDTEYYDIVGNYVFLAIPITIGIVILYHKGFIFKPNTLGR